VTVDFTPPFKRISMVEGVEQAGGFKIPDLTSDGELDVWSFFGSYVLTFPCGNSVPAVPGEEVCGAWCELSRTEDRHASA